MCDLITDTPGPVFAPPPSVPDSVTGCVRVDEGLTQGSAVDFARSRYPAGANHEVLVHDRSHFHSFSTFSCFALVSGPGLHRLHWPVGTSPRFSGPVVLVQSFPPPICMSDGPMLIIDPFWVRGKKASTLFF